MFDILWTFTASFTASYKFPVETHIFCCHSMQPLWETLAELTSHRRKWTILISSTTGYCWSVLNLGCHWVLSEVGLWRSYVWHVNWCCIWFNLWSGVKMTRRHDDVIDLMITTFVRNYWNWFAFSKKLLLL